MNVVTRDVTWAAVLDVVTSDDPPRRVDTGSQACFATIDI